MRLYQKLTIRIAVLAGIIVAINFIYSKTLYKKDFVTNSPIIENIRNLPTDCKVVYLAESSNFTYYKDDKDKRRISEFSSDFYPGLNCCYLDQAAMHAGNFKYVLYNIPENSKIETIIVTMNLRSFGADWIYSKLETALQKQMVFLHKRPPLVNRMFLAFKGYDLKDEEERHRQVLKEWGKENLSLPPSFPYKCVNEWDKARANGSILDSIGNWDMAKIQLSCHYVKTYAFRIDTLTNARIKDFDEIVKYAKKRGWNLVFNLLAENTEKASELVEPELLLLMRQNRDLLVKRYSRMGVLVVDNLEDVHDKEYIDQNWTTEHYTETGRKIVARNLADSLKKIYPQYYSAPDSIWLPN